MLQGVWISLIADGTVKNSLGRIHGMLIAKAMSGTNIVLRDGGAAGAVRHTIDMTGIPTGIPFYLIFPAPLCGFQTDIYAAIGGNVSVGFNVE